jgi:Tfp pilus assembly protein PilF
VSRKGCVLALIAAVLASGCASAGPKEADRLRAQAAHERGWAHFQDRQASAALVAFQEAVALDPTSAEYRNALGFLYLELQRPDQALEHFKRAVDLNPGLADAHLNLGIALAEGRRWEEAVSAYRKALTFPTLRSPYVANNNLGLALYHLKRHAEAEDALRFAIGLEPEQEAAYYNLGLVLAAMTRTDEAKAAFRRVREIGQDSPFGQAARDRLRALGDTQ